MLTKPLTKSKLLGALSRHMHLDSSYIWLGQGCGGEEIELVYILYI